MPRPLLEEIHPQPWRVLVGCILLNRASGVVAKPLANRLFENWGSPGAMAHANFNEVVSVLTPLGFQYRRAQRIIDLSNEWVRRFGLRDVPPEDFDPRELPGVGEYGYEAWRVFVRGDISFTPNDKSLRAYVEDVRGTCSDGGHGQATVRSAGC